MITTCLLYSAPGFVNMSQEMSTSVLKYSECCFTRNWADVNPPVTTEHQLQHQFSENVWPVILGNTLLGPQVLLEHRNGITYLQLL
ncbi:hypothetical protein Trydic_g475 [Trypoxylus dichotomus]